MSQVKKNKSNSISSARMIGATRFIMIVAVISIFIGSSVLLIIGTVDMLSGIWDQLNSGQIAGDNSLEIVLIESVDTILISTVLYVIAVGLYQLFINQDIDMPSWLQTNDVEELEHRMVGMVASILSVIFLTKAISGDDSTDLLYLGLAIGAVIIAISVFLYQEKK